MRKLKQEETYLFCSQMAMIISSGLGIQEGLRLMQEESKGSYLQEVCEALNKEIIMEGSLSLAVKKLDCFDHYMTEMLTVGEESGHMDSVLEELVVYYERMIDLKGQLKEAITYPLVLLATMVVVVGIIVVKVLPIFQDVLHNLGTELSQFSLMFMQVGQTFGMVCFVILLVLAVVLALSMIYQKTHPNAEISKKFLSSFFLSKKLYYQTEMAHITYAIALFLSSGYPLEQALGYLKTFANHPVIAKKLAVIEKEIKMGTSFVEANRKENLYQGMYANMVSIGFQSGKSDDVMKSLASLYEKEVEQSIARFLNVIEPAIVAILSVIVGIILLSVMLPLMSIMTSIS